MITIVILIIFFTVLAVLIFGLTFRAGAGVSRDIMNAHDDRVDRKLAEKAKREQNNG